MDDLKNYRPGAKTKKERGKKREEKKNGRQRQAGELIHARTAFSWRTC
jgi:hypothetical protein